MCMHMYLYVYICIYVYTSPTRCCWQPPHWPEGTGLLYMCVYNVCVCACICTYMFIYVYIYVHVSDSPPPSLRGVLRSTPPPRWPEGIEGYNIYIYICVCVCTIYAYVYVYIYVYICIHVSDSPPPSLRGVLRSTPPPHWPESAGL